MDNKEQLIANVPQNCLVCGKFCKNRKSLCMHIAYEHKEFENAKDYVDKCILHGERPLCACGCGEFTTWKWSKFYYNTFITGHNPSPWSKHQHKHTAEQIEKRNNSIRKTYVERKEELTKKISDAVTKTAQTDEYKENLRNGLKRRWSRPEEHEKHSLAQKRSWEGEAGEIRYKKVFTPEFRRKIGLANMRRGLTFSSKEEMKFFEHLKTFIDESDLESNKWFNFEERTLCADVYIKSLNLIIEFDGIYWHGFDRNSDYTLDQIKNITNDIHKNALAITKKLSFLRIPSNIDLTKLSSLDDLFLFSTHYVKDGVVIKEGTFAIDETSPVISRDSLIKINETNIFPPSKGREYTDNEILPAIMDLFKSHVGYWGWFYPHSDEDVYDVLRSLKMTLPASPNVCLSNTGSSWLKSRVHSFWDVDNGPSQAFYNDKALDKVLRYRLGLNNSKDYTYTLADGQSVTCREHFDINLKNVRTGFIVQRSSVSWFRPAAAASIYRKYLSTCDDPVVWDPSIGFSARLLAFASMFPNGTYIGTDPAKMMYDDALVVANELRQFRPNVKFDLHNVGSELFCPQESSVDLVFTSPPYFDKEKYVDEPGQCWKDYPTLSSWIAGYLRPTFVNAFRCLKNHGIMAINVDGHLFDVVIQTALSVGFTREECDDCVMPIKKDHFSKKRGNNNKNIEKVLAFRK